MHPFLLGVVCRKFNRDSGGVTRSFPQQNGDDVVESQDGQWVYPARGLAVFTTLADTEVARVVAFAPTTISAYRARLARGLEPPREIEAP